MRLTPEAIEKGKTALAAIRWTLTNQEHCPDHGPVGPEVLWDLEGNIGAHCPICHSRLEQYPLTPMFVWIANIRRTAAEPKEKQMDLFGDKGGRHG